MAMLVSGPAAQLMARAIRQQLKNMGRAETYCFRDLLLPEEKQQKNPMKISMKCHRNP